MRRLPVEVAWMTAAALAALLLAAWVLDFPGAVLSEPWDYKWDALQIQALFKTVLDTGWPGHTDALGAPFGQDGYDVPLLGLGPDLFLVKALGIFASSPFTAFNAFYVISFPVAAASAFAVLRALGVSRPAAFSCGVLFALAPYHFQKGEQQVLIGSLYAVPLLAYLALRAARAESLFGGRRTWVTVALCALVGTSGLYYTSFAIILVTAGAVLGALAAGRRAFAHGALAVVMIAASFAVYLAPALVSRAKHGANPQALARPAQESETFALKLDQLVFPVAGHRIDALGKAGERLNRESPIPSERTGNLGFVGVAGLTWLALVALAGAAGARRPAAKPLERATSALTVTAILVATVGGLSAVIAFGITPYVRAWGRMAIVIAFFALLAVALLLDRLGGRRLAAAAAAVLVLGTLDQTTTAFRPDYGGAAAQYRFDSGFAHELERRLGRGARLLMLPYAPYPENRAYWADGDFEHMRPYLTSRLRTSYGAVKGRAADWQATLNDAPLAALVDGAAASGFSAVWVDGAAYADGGVALRAELGELLGEPFAGSDRYSVYRLQPRDDPAARADTVTPVRFTYGSGFGARTGSGEDFSYPGSGAAELVLDNPGGERRVRYLAQLDPGVTIRLPNGRSASGDVDVTFTVPPGRSTLSFVTSGAFEVRAPVLVGASLCAKCGPRPQLR